VFGIPFRVFRPQRTRAARAFKAACRAGPSPVGALVWSKLSTTRAVCSYRYGATL